MSALGEQLKATRAARGLNLREAAEQSGVSFNTIARIERGKDCTHGHALALQAWIHGPLDGRTVDEAFAEGYAAGIAAAQCALADLNGARP